MPYYIKEKPILQNSSDVRNLTCLRHKITARSICLGAEERDQQTEDKAHARNLKYKSTVYPHPLYEFYQIYLLLLRRVYILISHLFLHDIRISLMIR